MPNVINQMIVRELSSSFEGIDAMLVVSMAGLTVAETEAIRTSLAEQGIRLRVIRNRLARIALASHGLEPPKSLLQGSVAVAWGNAEVAIQAARVFSKSDARKQGKLEIRGGLLEGNVLGADEANALASLPGKDELRAMLLGVISGPARNLVGLVNAPGSSLARVLQARIEQAEKPPG